ncbi:MAG: ComF family protein [Rickettsiales bacterium]
MEIHKKIQNFLYPAKCIACEDYVAKGVSFCVSCFRQANSQYNLNKCTTCGETLEYDFDNSICMKCIANPPFIDEFKFLFKYNEPIKKVMRKIKFSDQTQLLKIISKIIVNQSADFINGADIILYVPMHKRRLKQRFFNQSALLAKYIGAETGKQILYKALVKSKDTLRQTTLDKRARLKNIRNSFKVINRKTISNKKVLLVDDVSTTGATLNECARVLKKAGAERVFCLTFAKTTL